MMEIVDARDDCFVRTILIDIDDSVLSFDFFFLLSVLFTPLVHRSGELLEGDVGSKEVIKRSGIEVHHQESEDGEDDHGDGKAHQSRIDEEHTDSEDCQENEAREGDNKASVRDFIADIGSFFIACCLLDSSFFENFIVAGEKDDREHIEQGDSGQDTEACV